MEIFYNEARRSLSSMPSVRFSFVFWYWKFCVWEILKRKLKYPLTHRHVLFLCNIQLRLPHPSIQPSKLCIESVVQSKKKETPIIRKLFLLLFHSRFLFLWAFQLFALKVVNRNMLFIFWKYIYILKKKHLPEYKANQMHILVEQTKSGTKSDEKEKHNKEHENWV